MAKRFKLSQGAKPNFLPLEGITVSGDIIEFDDRFSDEDIKGFRDRVSKGFLKSYSYSEAGNFRIKASTPSESDKERIQEIVKGDVDIDSFGVYTFIAAETVKDTQGDVLTKEFLSWMGKKYESGRPLNDGHSWNHRVGKTFAYKVAKHEQAEGEFQLEVKAYVPPGTRTMSGNIAKEEIDTGIVDRVSVSFTAPVRFLEEDHEDNKWGGATWIFDKPKESSNSDVFELSLVTMGAQKGARIKGEKGGIAKNPTFETTEIVETKSGKKLNKMDLVKYTFKKTGAEIELPQAEIQKVKDLEKAYTDQAQELEKIRKELKVFTDAEATEKEAAVDQLVNLKVQLYKFAPETEKAKCEKLTLSEIKGEIEALAAAHKGNPIFLGDNTPDTKKKSWVID